MAEERSEPGPARAVWALAGRVRSLPSRLRGVAVETAWGATHLLIYPWGLRRDHAPADSRTSLRGLSPLRRGLVVGDVEAAGTPILLVHGMVDNKSVFALLRRGLRRRGFGTVTTVNYSPFTSDVRRAAGLLGGQVEAVCSVTGYERIHVVAHSMGGLIARYYVQRLGGDARVHTLVTMGTPHGGSQVARWMPGALARQLRPDSDVLAELDAPAAGCRTRFVAFWSDQDQMILPPRNGQITHRDLSVRNVHVRGVGHMSLAIDGRVAHEICTTLALLNPDGHRMATPVTAFPSSASTQ
jgi:triacylglycerol lipase